MSKTVNYQEEAQAPELEFNVKFEDERFSDNYSLDNAKPVEPMKKGALKKSTFANSQPTTVA